MFTGIIKEVVPILNSSKKKDLLELTVKTPKGWKLKLGESISISGVCLTVSVVNKGSFKAALMPETLRKTIFGRGAPKVVNIERCLKASDLLGGHIVLGHVDVVGTILNIYNQGSDRIYKISFPKNFSNLVVEKGSITIDGISLTIVSAGKDFLTVALIPYTLKHTTVGGKAVGDKVNLEFDIIAKHISAAARKY